MKPNEEASKLGRQVFYVIWKLFSTIVIPKAFI